MSRQSKAWLVACVIGAARLYATVSAEIQTPLPVVPPPQQAISVMTPDLMPREYKVGAGDTIHIEVLNDKELFIPRSYPVQPDGTIAFYQSKTLQALVVKDLTTQAISEAIKKGIIADGLETEAVVSVTIDAYHSQQFFIQGDVQNPGYNFLSADQFTLTRALAAGKPNATADVIVTVRRNRDPNAAPTQIDVNRSGPDVISLSYNREDLDAGRIDDPPLKNGDTVYVPKAKTLLVNGEVRSAGVVVLKPGMTVFQAITAAGGLTPQGALKRCSITRLDPTTGKPTKVPGVKETTLVQADDTVTVPKRYF
jgi:protein involved in polysaccharide export with SLBB domain